MAETGGAGTSWSSLSVDQMWAMLQGQNQAGHDRLIQGWQQAADVAEQHIDYLEDYQDRLAVVWPPSSSDAARACHDQLDVMIQNMRETWSTALSNRSTLETTAGALDEAYTTMQRIQQEYAQNKISLAQYDQKILTIAQEYAGRPVATPPSPVPGGRQAALEAEARALMSSLSTELAIAKSMIRTPPTYELNGSERGAEDVRTGRTGTGGGISDRGILRLSTLKDERDAQQAKDSDTSGDGAGTVRPSTGDSSTGPILVGTSPPAVSGPTTGPAVPPHQPGPLDHHTSTTVPTMPGPGRIVGGSPTAPVVGPPPAGRTSTDARTPFGRSQPAAGNGLIGGPGATSGTPAVGRPVGSRELRRVNPVGGVLGETPTAPRSTTGGPGTMNGRARRSDDRADDRDIRRWDPDHPWETDTGVASLLDSPPEHHINPGPAIGLPKP